MTSRSEQKSPSPSPSSSSLSAIYAHQMKREMTSNISDDIRVESFGGISSRHSSAMTRRLSPVEYVYMRSIPLLPCSSAYLSISRRLYIYIGWRCVHLRLYRSTSSVMGEAVGAGREEWETRWTRTTSVHLSHLSTFIINDVTRRMGLDFGNWISLSMCVQSVTPGSD